MSNNIKLRLLNFYDVLSFARSCSEVWFMSGMGTSFAAAEIMEEMRLMFNEDTV